jgi:hypothetical protein
MVSQIAPTQTQLENRTKRNRIARDHRHRHHALAQKIEDIVNQNQNLIEAMHDEFPSP